MAWWIWIAVGAAMLLAEVLTPIMFVFLFFGIGGLAVGLLDVLGVAGPEWLQWLLFSVISLLSLALFRPKLLARLSRGTAGRRPIDSLAGETARTIEAIAVDGIGRADLRGTPWRARNVGPEPLAAGQTCKVERVEGLMLLVRA
ncbi:MAG TPA: NfeD family protein [Thermoanaerobaculia bacterium]|nr:NfeD family protein [Thermoanaerobaculia bacterium]